MEESCSEPGSAPVPQSILVVEDEILIRLMIADDLVQAGFYVIQAATGEDALTVLQSSFRVDVLLTDIRMPGKLDGAELARRVRATWPDVKIVILSAQHRANFAAAPADAVLSKPYNPTNLINCLNQLLGSP